MDTRKPPVEAALLESPQSRKPAVEATLLESPQSRKLPIEAALPESPQWRPHWLLLIYSFQFRSSFRVAPARHRHYFHQTLTVLIVYRCYIRFLHVHDVHDVENENQVFHFFSAPSCWLQ